MLTWQPIVLMLADLGCLAASVVLAFILRFDSHVPTDAWLPLWPTFPFGAAVWLLSFRMFHLYRQAWRFAGIETAVAVVKGTTLGLAGLVACQFLIGGRSFPRSVIFITWLLAVGLVGGTRMALRLANGYLCLRRQCARSRGRRLPEKRVLVVGAGEAGAMVVEGMRNHPETGYRPVGFVDDDPAKQGAFVSGVRVVGSRAKLPDLLAQGEIAEVIIAMPTAEGSMVGSVVRECRRRGVPTKIVPGIVELIAAGSDVSNLREVQVEDLLGRPPVEVDVAASFRYLRGKRVLITGAGGSIGSELSRQVMARQPSVLLLLGHGETSIHAIHGELLERHPEAAGSIVPVIADIQDRARLEQVFASYRPEIVFHGAAHKHVPLMEHCPCEAVKNNVCGTINLMQVADHYRAEKFILVSTDKAVRPRSVLGATKRITEMMVQSRANANGTHFVAVRLGNVLGSRGSVVPTFKRQIERGGPVCVTHPEMTRYFMTVPESVLLVLQASAYGENGDLFVLDMGKPVRIVDLAEDLIRLSGREPHAEIPIIFTGVRPGEKLHEELIGEHEETSPTRDKQLLRIRGNHLDTSALENAIRDLATLAVRGDAELIVAKLQEVVPEYQPPAIARAAPLVPPMTLTEVAQVPALRDPRNPR